MLAKILNATFIIRFFLKPLINEIKQWVILSWKGRFIALFNCFPVRKECIEETHGLIL
jgi:hypothetical protein